MGQFFYFQNKLGHHLRHRHLHAVRIFADDAQEKWRPKFLKSFMLLAHNSTRLCLLEFCFSVFCCSSLNEIRQCRIQVCPALSLTKQCSASSFTRTSYHSTLNLIYVKDQQLFYNTAKSQLGIFGHGSVLELQSFPPHATRLRGFRQILRDRKVKKIFASLSFA